MCPFNACFVYFLYSILCLFSIIFSSKNELRHTENRPWAHLWTQKSLALNGSEQISMEQKIPHNKELCGMSGSKWTLTDSALLPNTEAGENTAQQIVGGKLAGDLTQRLLRQTQLLRQQFASPGAKQL